MTITYTERSVATEAYSDRGAIAAPAMRERGTITAAFYTTDTSVSTRDDTAPVISNIHANLLYADNAEIDWDTDEMATCQVKWTTDSSLAYESWTSGTIHEHLVTNNRNYALSPLTEKTTYYFMVQSADPYGNGAISLIHYFKTPGVDNTPGTLPAQAE
jgi:hypothetical protein